MQNSGKSVKDFPAEFATIRIVWRERQNRGMEFMVMNYITFLLTTRSFPVIPVRRTHFC
jgi:hypothetical protein